MRSDELVASREQALSWPLPMPAVEGRPFPALTPGQRYEFDALGVSRPLRAP